MSARRPGLATLCWLYAALLGGSFALAAAAGDWLWWAAFLSDLALALLLPLPALLALALWGRSQRALIGLLIPLSLACWLFGAQFLPGRARELQPGETPISAATVNVLYTNRNFAALAGAIRAAGPDVVGLQEVTPKIIAGMAAELAADYPYYATALPPNGSGVMLLSRHPIAASRSFALPPREAALHAEVQAGGSKLQVLVAHLMPSRKFSGPLEAQPAAQRAFFATRAGEVAAIEREVRAAQGPLLLLCDCNMSDTGAAHARMGTFLRDSFGEVGWGLGLTQLSGGWLPVQRIDYVWFTGGLAALSAETWRAPGADHRMVVARFALAQAAANLRVRARYERATSRVRPAAYSLETAGARRSYG